MPTSSDDRQPAAPPAALTVAGLSAGYGDTPTIMDVDLTVGRGEIVTVLGPNGAGKSTLLKAVLGVIRPMAGSVRLGDRDLTTMRSDQICRLSVGYVPQVRDNFPRLTVLENLEMGGYTHAQIRRQGPGGRGDGALPPAAQAGRPPGRAPQRR